jgi:hypothetical protein
MLVSAQGASLVRGAEMLVPSEKQVQATSDDPLRGQAIATTQPAQTSAFRAKHSCGVHVRGTASSATQRRPDRQRTGATVVPFTGTFQ